MTRSEGKARRAGGEPRGLTKTPVVVLFLLLCSSLLAGCAEEATRPTTTSGSSGSSAACGQGLPEVEPSRAAPGEAFRLSGGGFGGGCDDSNLPFRPDPPQQDIRIEMRQGGKAWDLATVDAGGPPRYAIDVRLRVPEGAEPGRAVIVIPVPNSAEPLKVPFRVLGGRAG
jgi:hypothetical protein